MNEVVCLGKNSKNEIDSVINFSEILDTGNQCIIMKTSMNLFELLDKILILINNKNMK